MCSDLELAMLKCCKYIKNYFYIIKIPHAPLNMSVTCLHAKYWKDTLKALGGVDFTMYALLTIIQ